ncbi:hypothetical protein FVE85_6314 [Porphyridium purpureum]|uniref:Zinc finger Sec23/Sec24-type domain-containing protein n=1 Tax=Porphyridium purpureum TaxID=35688 RepID=A0A5J4Z423_PORPP|nr:hypothetical protein FVE85_6314 [Porphyridium purpureum]|eukprot:POR5662..scf295_1
MLRSCSERFPADAVTKNGAALPWAIAFSPLLPLPLEQAIAPSRGKKRPGANGPSDASDPENLDSEETIGRCAACGAYVCNLARVAQDYRWRCVLCGRKNTLPSSYVNAAEDWREHQHETTRSSQDVHYTVGRQQLSRTSSVKSDRSDRGRATGGILGGNAIFPEFQYSDFEVDLGQNYADVFQPAAVAAPQLPSTLLPAAEKRAAAPDFISYLFVIDFSIPMRDLESVLLAVTSSVQACFGGSKQVVVGVLVIGHEGDDRVGVLDFSGRVPVLRSVSPPPAAGTQAVAATVASKDILSTLLRTAGGHLLLQEDEDVTRDSLLARVVQPERFWQPCDSKEAQQRFARAMDALQDLKDASAKRKQQSSAEPGRQVSGVIRLVIDFFLRRHGPAARINCCRVTLFLGGPPLELTQEQRRSSSLQSESSVKDSLIKDEESGTVDAFELEHASSSFAKSRSSSLAQKSSRLASRSFAWLRLASHNVLDIEARLAAQLGIMIDVVASRHYVLGLASIQRLVHITGGRVVLCMDWLDSDRLHDDLVRSLTEATAFQGVLRIRTTPEFQVARLYASSFQSMASFLDAGYTVYSFAMRGERSCVAADLAFCNIEGFMGSVLAPCMQVAYRYTRVYQDKQGNMRLARLLRVCTRSFGTAQSKTLIQKECDMPVVLKVLLHKFLLAAQDQGEEEASLMLRDWLANLVCCGPQAASQTESSSSETKGSFSGAGGFMASSTGTTASRVEALASIPALAGIPRIVFGLMRSRLTARAKDAGNGENVPCLADDEQVALRLLWTSLPPESLVQCVYPRLVGFETIESSASRELVLSSKSLLLHDGKYTVFLLDAYDTVVIFYTQRAKCTYPPPIDSKLMQTVVHVSKDRPFGARIELCREGSSTPQSRLFSSLLIEDGVHTSTLASFSSVSSASAGGMSSRPGEVGRPLLRVPYTEFLKVVDRAARQLES